MAKIAVDVVLLPSKTMTDKAIEANRALLKTGQSGSEIVLGKENCLPHISLAMGCIDEKDIDDIGRVLQRIAVKAGLSALKVSGVHIGTNSVGEKVSALKIERTEALQSLHEEISEKAGSYFSYDVSAEMFWGAEAGESSLLWVRNYRERASFENFFPHITIGYGEIGNFSIPTVFLASKLALCHLGNHCTCRKVLTSTGLKSTI